MAQAGFTPISLYFSTTAAAVPTSANLVAGELALNTVDEKLYFKNSAGTVKLLASNATSAPVLSFQTSLSGLTPSTATTGVVTLAGTLGVASGGTGLTAGTSGGVLAYTASGTLASSTALAASALVIGGGAGAAPSTTTTGTGVVTALGVNTGSAGAFVVNGGALGSPSSVGTMPAFTLGGTVSGGGNQINNVIIGTTTPLAGAFTTVTASTPIGTASGGTGLGGATPFTANGVVYASSSSVLATGSALTFDGTNLILGAANPNFQGSSSTGSATLINNSGGAFVRVYGGSHASKANFTDFINGSSTSTFDSAGNLGLGVTPSATANYVKMQISGSTGGILDLLTGSTRHFTAFCGSSSTALGTTTNTPLLFQTNDSERARIDSSGNVGIGTSSPGSYAADADNLVLASSGNTGMTIKSGATSTGNLFFANAENSTSNNASIVSNHNDFAFNFDIYGTGRSYRFKSAGTEVLRITSAGDVGIGTSAPVKPLHIISSSVPQILMEPSLGSGNTELMIGRGYSLSGTPATVGTKSFIQCAFEGSDDNAYSPFGYVTTAVGNRSQIATAFYIETKSAGSSTPSERMRIDSSGNLLVGTTTNSPAANNVVGAELQASGSLQVSKDGASALQVNRKTDDGELVAFRQDGTQEGSISVSGTTVSYNGGHLSRWAQTTTAKDDTLVKGTVLSNLDEMNVYTKDGQPVDNEQLNKVKVSDTEGDVNVAGVFVNWSHDEDHNVDEINMAMTGDMIIRIAQGTTVARGDLLMSAGDGTAKPQGDDIIRSKTVAKVTSTHVTCTYADGSYCVPCVLMAC